MPEALEISHLRGQGGAVAARGLTVLIDVLRAFTTAAYAFAGGAREIVLVRTVEEAFALRQRFPDALLIGEVGGRHVPGFDLNNSPTLMERSDVEGRRLIQRTGAGTQAVLGAADADERVLGSLVVARATVAYVRTRAPARVSLVSTNAEDGPLNEDDACARYLGDLLRGATADAPAVISDVRTAARERLLHERLGADFPATDVDLATAIDRFSFAMRVERVELTGDGTLNLVARRVDP